MHDIYIDTDLILAQTRDSKPHNTESLSRKNTVGCLERPVRKYKKCMVPRDCHMRRQECNLRMIKNNLSF